MRKSTFGAGFKDAVDVRIFVIDIKRDWEAVGRAHAELLGYIRPATSMVAVRRLTDDRMLSEIEADAMIDNMMDVRATSQARSGRLGQLFACL